MEESEVCSLPGGLASVRRQFETQEAATSHNVTQFYVHHRTVQVHNVEHGCTGQEHESGDRGHMTASHLAFHLLRCTRSFASKCVNVNAEI